MKTAAPEMDARATGVEGAGVTVDEKCRLGIAARGEPESRCDGNRAEKVQCGGDELSLNRAALGFVLVAVLRDQLDPALEHAELLKVKGIDLDIGGKAGNAGSSIYPESGPV